MIFKPRIKIKIIAKGNPASGLKISGKKNIQSKINIIHPNVDKQLKLYLSLNLSKNIVIVYKKVKGKNNYGNNSKAIWQWNEGSINRVFTNEEIGQMSPDEFSRLENFINQQIAEGKVMPEAQAKQQVQTGDLIYVNSYTRSDGTEVKGYYRSKPRI